MAEKYVNKYKDDFTLKRSLQTKVNIYLALIVVVTIFLFDIIAIQSNHSSVFIHLVHTVVTIILIITLVNFVFSKLIFKPLNDLVRAMRNMEEGKFTPSLEAQYQRDDEIGWLITRFCKMRERLQRLVRSEKRDSASSVIYRMQRELRDPLNNLEKNINALSLTLNNIEPIESQIYVEEIQHNLERNLNLIKTFSGEVGQYFHDSRTKEE